MAFKFSLATVLHAREIAEKREERVLQQILQEIAGVHQAVILIEDKIAEANALRYLRTHKSMKANALCFSSNELALLQLDRSELQTRISKLETLKENQFKIYRAARCSHETLTGMRNDLKAKHETNVSKHEQQVLDDNYVARRNRPYEN